MADDTLRLIADGYAVPALPASIRQQVFGTREADFARIELAVLQIEQWVAPGISPWLARTRVLDILRRYIRNDINAWDLVRLLASRGHAERFFALTQPIYDTDSELRKFLIDNSITIDVIRFYSKWDGVDPDLFLKGFALGVVESGASTYIGLLEVAKLALRMQQAELKTVLLLVNDFEEGVQSLQGQVVMVGSVLKAIVSQLDPTALPARIVETWDKWNMEFSRNLDNADAFAAGRTLGRVGGDLWQILTGVRAFVELLGIGYRMALNYVPLIMGRIQRAASEARILIGRIAALLQTLGKGVIDGLQKVGMGFLRTLFPRGFLKHLSEGFGFSTHGGFSVVLVPELAYANAYGGNRMGGSLAAIVSDEKGPFAMATLSSPLPPVGRPESEQLVDEIIHALDQNIDVDALTLKRSTALRTEMARALLLEQQLESRLAEEARKATYQAFLELLKDNQGRVSPRDLGLAIHAKMKEIGPALVSELSPDLTTFAEKQISTIVEALTKKNEKAIAILEDSVASVLLKHEDANRIFDFLDIGAKADDRTEAALSKVLARRFKWGESTTAGRLQADLVLADTRTFRVINVDWTSSTQLDGFDQLLKQIRADLGDQFDGDWNRLADAYAKAGKGEIPPEVLDKVEKATAHATRETIVRQAILEVALREAHGPATWYVKSQEILYDGIKKLYEKFARVSAGQRAPSKG
jgi:hypothetical protein